MEVGRKDEMGAAVEDGVECTDDDNDDPKRSHLPIGSSSN